MKHRHDPQEQREDKDRALHLDWMCSAAQSLPGKAWCEAFKEPVCQGPEDTNRPHLPWQASAGTPCTLSAHGTRDPLQLRYGNEDPAWALLSVSEFGPVSGPASWMDSRTTAEALLQSCLQPGFLLLFGWAPWKDPGPGLLLAMSGAVYPPCHQHPALPTVFEPCVTAPGVERDCPH